MSACGYRFNDASPEHRMWGEDVVCEDEVGHPGPHVVFRKTLDMSTVPPTHKAYHLERTTLHASIALDMLAERVRELLTAHDPDGTHSVSLCSYCETSLIALVAYEQVKNDGVAK